MSLEENRLYKIKIISRNLGKVLESGVSVDYEDLVREINLLFGASRRTSMDYLDLAMKDCRAVAVLIDGTREIIHRGMAYDKIKDKTTNIMRDISEKELSCVRGA